MTWPNVCASIRRWPGLVIATRKTGHFIGVWRRDDGAIVLNLNSPGQGEAHEFIITVDGKETPYERPKPKDYDPRTREWYRSAILSDTTVLE